MVAPAACQRNQALGGPNADRTVGFMDPRGQLGPVSSSVSGIRRWAARMRTELSASWIPGGSWAQCRPLSASMECRRLAKLVAELDKGADRGDRCGGGRWRASMECRRLAKLVAELDKGADRGDRCGGGRWRASMQRPNAGQNHDCPRQRYNPHTMLKSVSDENHQQRPNAGQNHDCPRQRYNPHTMLKSVSDENHQQRCTTTPASETTVAGSYGQSVTAKWWRMKLACACTTTPASETTVAGSYGQSVTAKWWRMKLACACTSSSAGSSRRTRRFSPGRPAVSWFSLPECVYYVVIGWIVSSNPKVFTRPAGGIVVLAAGVCVLRRGAGAPVGPGVAAAGCWAMVESAGPAGQRPAGRGRRAGGAGGSGGWLLGNGGVGGAGGAEACWAGLRSIDVSRRLDVTTTKRVPKVFAELSG